MFTGKKGVLTHRHFISFHFPCNLNLVDVGKGAKNMKTLAVKWLEFNH